MNIKLNTINDVNEFVLVCSMFHNIDINVKQGRQIIDAKSILGIYSLNLLQPLTVAIYSDNKEKVMEFFEKIDRWKVNYKDEMTVS